MTTDLVIGQGQQANSNELATAGAAASAQHEIQSAIIIARKFPRNEEQCFQELMAACKRPSFAEDATYSFPRGDAQVEGPSVNLAREAGRIWGNIRFGLYIVREDEESMLIRGWAWDIQKNTKVEHDDSFKKLIQRKGKGWVVPDERDLRELTNRRGAILVRNSLLQVMPKDLIEDALYQCSQTLEDKTSKDPEAAKKRLLVDFATINVTVEMLEKRLGHPFAQASPKELTELRGICNSIQNGNSTWAEYVKEPDARPADPNKDKLAEGQEALKKQREAPEETKKEQPAQEQPAEKKANQGITAAEAKSRLRAAETPKEVAETMNAFMLADSTAEERKDVTAAKDEAMKRLSKKK